MPANTPNDTDASDRGSSESSLVWGTSSFEPGSDVGLVSRYTVGLVERDNPSTRDRLWQLVADDAPLDDILDELSSTGLKALPDFGIAQVEGDSVRVVARGRTTITAELASGDEHEVDPSGVRTWIEEVVADVVGLTISLSPLDDDAMPLSSEAFAVLAGSVPARSVTRRFDVADAHADEATTGWTATTGSPEAVVDEDLGSPPVADSSPELDAAEDIEEEVEDLEAIEDLEADVEGVEDVELELIAPAADDVAEGDSWFADKADDGPAAEVPPQPGELAEVESMSPQAADPQPASPQPSGPPAVDPQPASPQPSGPPAVDPQPASPQPSGPPAVDPQPAGPQPSGPPAGAGVTADPIEVPVEAGLSGPPPAGPGAGGPPPEATVVVGSDDGPVRGPVSSIFDDEEVAEPVTPTLPSDDQASAAGAEPLAADIGETAAPAAPQLFGVLAFSNGERIGVDRSVLIGRNPKVAGAVEGGLPHIMKFDGPGQGLSRTHAEVRIENGEMLLEDLQSTNGTEIQLPGQQRRRLRGGEPVVVVPGTLIDFGDELHCTVETAG